MVGRSQAIGGAAAPHSFLLFFALALLLSLCSLPRTSSVCHVVRVSRAQLCTHVRPLAPSLSLPPSASPSPDPPFSYLCSSSLKLENHFEGGSSFLLSLSNRSCLTSLSQASLPRRASSTTRLRRLTLVRRPQASLRVNSWADVLYLPPSRVQREPNDRSLLRSFRPPSVFQLLSGSLWLTIHPVVWPFAVLPPHARLPLGQDAPQPLVDVPRPPLRSGRVHASLPGNERGSC